MTYHPKDTGIRGCPACTQIADRIHCTQDSSCPGHAEQDGQWPQTLSNGETLTVTYSYTVNPED